MARLTYSNHRVHPDQEQTYRVPTERITEMAISSEVREGYGLPVENVGEMAFKTFGRSTALYGNVVDKLGRYEDLGEPEEIARRLGMDLRKWQKKS